MARISDLMARQSIALSSVEYFPLMLEWVSKGKKEGIWAQQFVFVQA